jgi:hypothetical protein
MCEFACIIYGSINGAQKHMTQYHSNGLFLLAHDMCVGGLVNINMSILSTFIQVIETIHTKCFFFAFLQNISPHEDS